MATVFTYSGGDQMIEGCKFVGGIYKCTDPMKEKSLRSSALFGKTLNVIEEKTMEVKVETTEPIKDEVKNDGKVQEEKAKDEAPEVLKDDQARYDELKAIGWKHFNPEQKAEYQALRVKLGLVE